MQKIFLILAIILTALFFQNCGNVNVNAAAELASEPMPEPDPDPVLPAAFVPYKLMILATSQCANSANNTCRSGMLSLDIPTAATEFFDLGPQASGNQPYFTKVFEQGDIVRFAVSQQFAVEVSANKFMGTVWLVEYSKSTKQFKKLLEETTLENSFSFFAYVWGDCNGDSVNDWIQYSGTVYPYKILCRSSVNGAVLKTLYSGGDLPRTLVKDFDGDGISDILSEGSYGKVAFYGSKTLAPGSAPVVTWNLPSSNMGLHYFPSDFDLDADGWNDVVDIPADNFNRSVFVYSGKTGQLLREIISPTGEKYIMPRAGKFLPGSAVQLMFMAFATGAAGSGGGLPKEVIVNGDGSLAGQFVQQDFFDSFAALTPKPTCWSGCLSPQFFSASLADLDGDGYLDFISNSFALFSLKNKTGILYTSTPQVYNWTNTPNFWR